MSQCHCSESLGGETDSSLPQVLRTLTSFTKAWLGSVLHGWGSCSCLSYAPPGPGPASPPLPTGSPRAWSVPFPLSALPHSVSQVTQRPFPGSCLQGSPGPELLCLWFHPLSPQECEPWDLVIAGCTGQPNAQALGWQVYSRRSKCTGHSPGSPQGGKAGSQGRPHSPHPAQQMGKLRPG
jgi:hypothetical protein